MLKNQNKGNQTNMDQAKKSFRKYRIRIIRFWKKKYSGVKQGTSYVAVKAHPATNQIKKGVVFMGHQVGGA